MENASVFFRFSDWDRGGVCYFKYIITFSLLLIIINIYSHFILFCFLVTYKTNNGY